MICVCIAKFVTITSSVRTAFCLYLICLLNRIQLRLADRKTKNAISVTTSILQTILTKCVGEYSDKVLKILFYKCHNLKFFCS